MSQLPFLQRLSTRLTLLILAVVAVLAGATAILLLRAVSLTGQGFAPGLEGALAPAETSAVVRGTMINIAAVFLFTLVLATVFSRSLLTEPIARLLEGTRALAEGRLGVTLPEDSNGELGELARSFNRMSLALAQRTRELTASNEALATSEERYELAIRGANDGLWDWDVEEGRIYLSPRWKSMLGYQPEEFHGTPEAWLALVHPDDQEGLRAELARRLEGGSGSVQLEHRLRHRDGSWRWVLARGAILRDENGQPVRLAGSLTDITERVEALSLLERRVQERTAELRALLELSNSTALTLELHPLLDRILGRLSEATGAAGAAVLELTGGGRAAVLAQLGALSIDPGLLSRAPDVSAPQLVGERLTALPLVVRESRVGLLLLAHAEAQALPEERMRLAAAFANQVAVALENAKLYDQVQEQAALEERQHLARELHDSVSQALYGILLGTHAVQKQLPEGAEQARASLAYVENLAQAGLAEMRALIFELRPESLEQHGLSGALKRQLEALETRHNLQVQGRICDEPELPLATKQVLYRVAQEALHNVVKHARARRVELTLQQHDGRLLLEVRDDGVGFDAERSFPGHLGLRSMRERVAGLGGSIAFQRPLEGGTQVSVELPLDPAQRSLERS